MLQKTQQEIVEKNIELEDIIRMCIPKPPYITDFSSRATMALNRQLEDCMLTPQLFFL